MAMDIETRDSSGQAVEPSVTTALERLVIASQGVITKRIDLALLEGQELLSHVLRNALLASASTVLAVAAWFALVGCAIESVAENQSVAFRFGLFAFVNAIAAVGLALGTRSISPPIGNGGNAHSHHQSGATAHLRSHGV